MSTIVFHAQFSAAKLSKTGITVTCQYDRIRRSDGTITTVTGLTPTAASKTYFYALAGADLQTYDYVATFITADATVDQQEVPALWTRYSEAVTTDAGGLVQLAPVTHTGATIPDVTTLTTYAGNTPQTGDAYARLGAAGAGLTAIGDARLANLDAAVSTRSTYAGGAVASVTAGVTVTTNNDKSGYSLASTGLNAIAVTAPTGVATTFPQMVVQTWRRFFKQATQTATQMKTYADDGTTVVTTQTLGDDGTTQTQGSA